MRELRIDEYQLVVGGLIPLSAGVGDLQEEVVEVLELLLVQVHWQVQGLIWEVLERKIP
ncbi:hypothetical protein [Pelistega ratti]|uniref:hypothetical protein n=1 Tax=Pelistega ratti TaxID=2652177 RepID=UPI00135CA5F0|nr:hypothetical protein [Pelistega ratti]